MQFVVCSKCATGNPIGPLNLKFIMPFIDFIVWMAYMSQVQTSFPICSCVLLDNLQATLIHVKLKQLPLSVYVALKAIDHGLSRSPSTPSSLPTRPHPLAASSLQLCLSTHHSRLPEV